MPLKPATLIYGVDDRPGWPTTILLGMQHVFLLSVGFIFPVVVVEAIGGTAEQARTIISSAMIATGVATILQGLNRGPIGSGFLCPLLNGPAFLSASILAGKAGGLSAIFGMTAIGGLCEALFSRIVIRMRAIFPAEVTGTIVTMVGIEVIPVAARRFFGLSSLHSGADPVTFCVAFFTLFAMVSLNVWSTGSLKLYSVLLGLLFGYAISIPAGLLTADHLRRLLDAPLITLPPLASHGLSFHAALLVPFLVATLSSALKAMGDLTICQKTNDASWKRPDMHSISRGILACSMGNMISGLTGGFGQSISSSNIGLSIATAATSRRIAFATGSILILLAFLPKLAIIYVVMPPPVMGAILVFAASFMILAGIQLMMSRMLDSRKTFVIGISIIFGLSVDFIPGLSTDVHPWVQPLFSSSLSLATVCAIIMNLIFRIGIAKSLRLALTPGANASDTIFNILQKQGGLWGARRDVVDRAALVINEFLETAASQRLSAGDIETEIRFDEFNLDVHLSYRGTPMEFPTTRPSDDELAKDSVGTATLSGFLIHKHVDALQSEMQDGICHLRFHFDH
jgi:xanthine permease XanP